MRHEGYVGQLQVQSAQPAVQLGFICGSLPVPTVNPSDTPLSPTQAALVPAINLLSQRASAPRYRLLPTETDLNSAPSNGIYPEEFLPVTASHDAGGLCNTWEGGYLNQPLARKCESLAVNALTGYGDEIDVVAPVDILKQIFKTPYCKSRLSVAVHRIGHTLILNSGPDIEEGEKIARRKKNQAKATERNLFSKFVQHSVHDESCDGSDSCPTPDSEGSSRTRRQPGPAPPGFANMGAGHMPWQVVEEPCSESTSCCSEDDARPIPPSTTRKGKQRAVSRRNHCEGGLEFQKAKFLREQQNTNFVPKDPEKPTRQSTSENFLRVLFWQFQNLRMLLGSDLLLFSNEKHAAVSLHLMEIERQVTPLMWLDTWLDNVMASIPELAVCYHRNGVVQGYELLKTDDIFLLKGLAEDGTAFFHPHVVQQNASSVLRFLQENCKQDPGTYWLFKNAGEDLMQLFDLSVISKTCNDKEDKNCGTLPSSRNRGNGHYSFPLAMLLYRLANRLSRSQDPADRLKCAKLFGKCLEFMDEQEHLVIRASAHEHAARLILTCYKQLGMMLQPLLLESNDSDSSLSTHLKAPALELPSEATDLGLQDKTASGPIIGDVDLEQSSNTLSLLQECQEVTPDCSSELTIKELVLANGSIDETSSFSGDCYDSVAVADSQGELTVLEPAPQVIRALADPISARLAAVHHISQAIKSLRWQRQLQDVGEKSIPQRVDPEPHIHTKQVTECICGEPECVAICNFRDIEVGFGMDEKLWQLLLLLGESYLALGQAYKEDGQLSRALKAAELACQARGSTPQLIAEDKDGIVCAQKDDTGYSTRNSNSGKESVTPKGRGLFWGHVWVFVGDVFAEIQRSFGETDIQGHQETKKGDDLKMPQEVMKEVKRLKKKVGQFRGNCEICSLTSCSCQNDRASSGYSASSSCSPSSASIAAKYPRKHVKRTSSKIPPAAAPDIAREQSETSSPEAEEAKEITIKSVTKATTPLFKQPRKQEPYFGDIFSYLGRPLTNDWESNLSAAFECYSCAVVAFADSIYLPEYEGALRKKGWACNELGRRRLAQGSVNAAEEAFEAAILSFRAVKDLPNIVLVYCNLAHGRRAAAEGFASQLSTWEDCQLPQFYFAYIETFAQARTFYQEALEFYGEGRRELMGWGDGVERTMRGLWNEVHTQLAHTYLKLGMLLARKEKFTRAHQKLKEQRAGAVGTDLGREKKSGLLAKEAISKALVLYESLGSLRAQEAAYAQFQLACQQRDCCLASLAGQSESDFEKGDSRLQGAKRFASMADRYWQKALEYYHAETHPDMFLQILMERSAMCLAVAPSFQPNMMTEWTYLAPVLNAQFADQGLLLAMQMLEQALSHLLEGCRVVRFNDQQDFQSTSCQPSLEIATSFLLQMQRLLKSMLGSAISATKPSGGAQMRIRKSSEKGNRSDLHLFSSRASDVEKLKEMYRVALNLTVKDDLRALCGMWNS